MSKKLYIGNLSYDVTSDQLGELFAEVGKIVEAIVITDRYSGQSKGFGFVELSTEKEAEEAIKKFNDTEFQGRKLVVNEARPREARPSPGRSYGSDDKY